MYTELADTLIALVDALTPPPASGVYITEAELELPLEVSSAEYKGKLIFLASPPHTIWKSGVLPRIHKSTLHIEIEEAAG
jgi:hypothetical protein